MQCTTHTFIFFAVFFILYIKSAAHSDPFGNPTLQKELWKLFLSHTKLKYGPKLTMKMRVTCLYFVLEDSNENQIFNFYQTFQFGVQALHELYWPLNDVQIEPRLLKYLNSYIEHKNKLFNDTKSGGKGRIGIETPEKFDAIKWNTSQPIQYTVKDVKS